MNETERVHREVLARGEHLFQRLQMRDAPAPEGRMAIEVDVRPEVGNPRGQLQGGLVTVLVDSVAGRLAQEHAPDGYGTATADMNVHYLSGITVGPARAEARIVRAGRRIIVLQVDVHDVGRDVLAATATISFAVLEPRP